MSVSHLLTRPDALTPSVDFETKHIVEVYKAINEYVHSQPPRQAFTDMLQSRLFESGRAKPIVYTEVLPLERVAEGLRLLEQRKTWGKVVVRIRDEKVSERAKL